MIAALREARQARGLTLAEVARRCVPPTTAQTIGRLETGTRTLSTDWLERIATALGTAPIDLLRLPEQAAVAVAAILSTRGADAPTRITLLPTPHPDPGLIGVMVRDDIGAYRAGDRLWCRRAGADGFSAALNRDVLVPRPIGRFLFGRLIGCEGKRLLILPARPGSRQIVLADPPWIAVAETLLRDL